MHDRALAIVRALVRDRALAIVCALLIVQLQLFVHLCMIVHLQVLQKLEWFAAISDDQVHVEEVDRQWIREFLANLPATPADAGAPSWPTVVAADQRVYMAMDLTRREEPVEEEQPEAGGTSFCMCSHLCAGALMLLQLCMTHWVVLFVHVLAQNLLQVPAQPHHDERAAGISNAEAAALRRTREANESFKKLRRFKKNDYLVMMNPATRRLDIAQATCSANLDDDEHFKIAYLINVPGTRSSESEQRRIAEQPPDMNGKFMLYRGKRNARWEDKLACSSAVVYWAGRKKDLFTKTMKVKVKEKRIMSAIDGFPLSFDEATNAWVAP